VQSFGGLFASDIQKKGSYLCIDRWDIVKEEIYADDFHVPVFTPKGVFGINTFLYLFFNYFRPIGTSLNPWLVHGGRYEGESFITMDHDFGHSHVLYGRIFDDSSKFNKLKLIYNHIFNSIVKEDEEKPK
jgi:hypothetical protein